MGKSIQQMSTEELAATIRSQMPEGSLLTQDESGKWVLQNAPTGDEEPFSKEPAFNLKAGKVPPGYDPYENLAQKALVPMAKGAASLAGPIGAPIAATLTSLGGDIANREQVDLSKAFVAGTKQAVLGALGKLLTIRKTPTVPQTPPTIPTPGPAPTPPDPMGNYISGIARDVATKIAAMAPPGSGRQHRLLTFPQLAKEANLSNVRMNAERALEVYQSIVRNLSPVKQDQLYLEMVSRLRAVNTPAARSFITGHQAYQTAQANAAAQHAAAMAQYNAANQAARAQAQAQAQVQGAGEVANQIGGQFGLPGIRIPLQIFRGMGFQNLDGWRSLSGLGGMFGGVTEIEQDRRHPGKPLTDPNNPFETRW